MTATGLVPLIRYRDVASAIKWLGEAFGFVAQNIVFDSDGTIAYAELSYGNGIVMVGPVGDSVLDTLLRQPDELGGIGTQSCYVAVDDVEGHFKRSVAAGAQIVLEFGSDETGDRAYAARDPEGHIWNFGAYSPWRSKHGAARNLAADEVHRSTPSRAQALLAAMVAFLAVATTAAVMTLEPLPATSRQAVAATHSGNQQVAIAASPRPDSNELAAIKAALEREIHARRDAARTAASIREELAREKAIRIELETERAALQEDLARERQARSELIQHRKSDTLNAAPSQRPADESSAREQQRPEDHDMKPTSPAATAAVPAPTTTGSLRDQANPGIPDGASGVSQPSLPPVTDKTSDPKARNTTANDDGAVSAAVAAPSSAAELPPEPVVPSAPPSATAAAMPNDAAEQAEGNGSQSTARPQRNRANNVESSRQKLGASKPIKAKPKAQGAKPSGAVDPLFMYD